LHHDTGFGVTAAQTVVLYSAAAAQGDPVADVDLVGWTW